MAEEKIKEIRIITIAALMVIIFGFFIIRAHITGFAVYEEGINVDFDNDVNYTWIPDEYGLIDSVTISGYIEGDSAEILLLGNTIYNYGEITPTAKAVGNLSDDISLNFSYGLEDYDNDNNGFTYIENVIDYNVKANFNFETNYSKLCTKYIINNLDDNLTTPICYGSLECCDFLNLEAYENSSWNESFYLNYGKHNAGYNNTLDALVVYYDLSLTEEDIHSYIYNSETRRLNAVFTDRVYFNSSVDNLNIKKDNYVLNILVDGLLHIDDISYGFANITNITANLSKNISVKQYNAKLNEKVKWEKTVKVDKKTNKVDIELPLLAENISVKKRNISGEIGDLELKKDKEAKASNKKEKNITIDEIIEKDEEVIVEYYTKAPYSEEIIKNNKKEIKIIGPDEVHYTDVLVFTYLPNEVSDISKVKLYWDVNSTRELVDFAGYDSDDNGLYDYIEWLVPSLSNQSYQLVIEISSALHLDSERVFIKDIYENVSVRDSNFTLISIGEYVRVSFERNLTSDRDITIYAKSSSNGSVEVYEENSDDLIRTFSTINQDQMYKVYLTNLKNSQDTFDLKVINGSVEFDYIFDPFGTGGNISFVDPTPTNASSTPNTSIEINVSISEVNISEIIYNWNGTNYTIYNNSLVLMMNFDNVSALGENSTYVVDVSGNGNNGTMNSSGPNWTSSGRYGGAFEFDGVDDFINISAFNYAFTELSILAWAYVDTPASCKGLVYSRGTSVTGLELGGCTDSTRLGYTWNDDENTYNWGGGPLIPTSEWFLAALIVNSTQATIYAVSSNGSASGTNVLAHTSTTIDDLKIGQDDAGGRFFNGSIDEVRIWNRSLSSDEIYQQYVYDLNKFNSTQWYLYVNQSKNATTNLEYENYTYQAYVLDTSSNWNSTEQRTITIDQAPIWSNNKTNITMNTLTGEIVYFNITLNDSNSDKYIFSWYNGSIWANDSVVSYTNGQEIQVTKKINSSPINWTWFFNDTYGNLNQTDEWGVVLNSSISISRIYPTINISVSQNEFFNVTVNTTCTSTMPCGRINVSLDPTSTIYNFTTCGTSGRTGPSQDDCDTNYTGTTLADLVNVNGGIQNWTVPSTGTYIIEAYGAGFGNYANQKGALMNGSFELTEGDVLKILVGQIGNNSWCGSGGTFVAYANNTAIIVAGGAGGGIANDIQMQGNISTSGASDSTGTYDGGTDGSGGEAPSGSCYATSGAGFTGNGNGCDTVALSFTNGGTGGIGNSIEGGFGGGGTGRRSDRIGGGGGYSGGGSTSSGSGGGGGSYNNGTDQTNTAGTNTGYGVVTITYVDSGKGGLINTTAGATPFYTNMSNPYNISLIAGESQAVTFWVNATGDGDNTYEFYVYANQTSRMSTSALTSKWNVTIIDNTTPTANFASPTMQNGTYSQNYIEINITSTDTHISKIVNYLHNSTGDQNGSSSGTSSPNYVNFSSLSDGTYYINATVNDSVDNTNSTITRKIILDTKPPQVSYLLSTVGNNTRQPENSTVINVSIVESSLNELKYNWNKTNYTLYNNSLVLMMNFDNITSIGENYNDSTDNKTIDLSKYGNNGTVAGPRWNKTGKYGGAFEFDAVNDQVLVNDSSSISVESGDATWSVWIKNNNAGQNSLYANCILDKEAGNNGGVFVYIQDNAVDLYLGDSGTGSGSITINNNIWYHVVVVKSDSTAKSYINGILDITDTWDSTPNSAGQNLSIGYDSITAGREFNGTIDEVRIWNRSLSEDEIYQEYVSNLNKFNSTQWYLYVNQSQNASYGLEEGNYTYNTFASDNLSNWNSSIERLIIIDWTIPTFSDLTNYSIEHFLGVAYDVNATDQNSISCFTVNDTTNFKINCSGYLENNTKINDEVYWLNITINDTAGNNNSKVIWVNVTDTTPPNFTDISNQTVEYGTDFISDVNATDSNNVSCFTVNDTNFKINCSGYLENNTYLSVALYWLNISLNDTVGNNESKLIWINVSDTFVPAINITYPDNSSYTNNTGVNINYSVSDLNLGSCWYSNDTMGVNTTLESCINITTITWTEAPHNITIWANDTYGNVNSSSIGFTVDINPPTFSGFDNQTTYEEDSFGRDMNATDSSGISCFTVNDTTDFKINCTGYLENNTLLNQSKVMLHWLNITVNDTAGNQNSSLMSVNITDKGRVKLDLVTPTGDLNASQNTTFLVSASVTCKDNDCGEVNVSLDPSSWENIIFDDFEGEVLCSATHQCGGTCVLKSSNWTNSDASWHWKSDVGGTPSSSTGPNIDHTIGDGTGYYLFTEASNPCYHNYSLQSAEIDTSSYSNITLWFWYHMYGAQTGTIYVDVNESGTLTENIWNISGQQQTGSNDAWEQAAVDLSSYSGTITVIIRGLTGTSSYTSDMAIDDINISGRGSAKGGIISTAAGDTPFYVNMTNPYNITLNKEESSTITWKVNATGTINDTHEFYVYANRTEDMSISNITSKWNVTIRDTTVGPTVTINYPQNTNYTTNVNELNYTVTSANELDQCWYSNSSGEWNSTVVAAETNFTSVSSIEGWNNWTVYCNDTSIMGNDNVEFYKDTIGSVLSGISPNRTIEFWSENLTEDFNATDASNLTFAVNDTGDNFTISSDGILTNATNLSIGYYILNITVNDTGISFNSTWYNVTVKDTTTPVLTGIPVNRTIEFWSENLTEDFNATDADDLVYGTNDTEDNFIIDSNGILTNSTNLSIGDYILNITINDSSGNSNSSWYNVTVKDAISPSWNEYPGNLSIEYSIGIVDIDFNASDNSAINYTINDTTNFWINDTNGTLKNLTVLSIGIHIVNITANDTSGRFNITTFNATVTDTIIPTTSSPPNTTIEFWQENITADFNASDVDDLVYGVNDTGDNFTIDTNGILTNSTNLSIGHYILNITINDSSGNSNSSWLNISVKDTGAPVIMSPPNRILEFWTENLTEDFNATDASTITFGINDTGDNFTISSDGILTNATNLSVGSYILNITVNDTIGNFNSTWFNITVTPDITPPTLRSITLNSTIGATGDIFNITVNVTDNNNISVVNIYIQRPDENNTIKNITLSLVNNSYNGTWNSINKTQGSYLIDIIVNDTLGNEKEIENAAIIALASYSVNTSTNSSIRFGNGSGDGGHRIINATKKANTWLNITTSVDVNGSIAIAEYSENIKPVDPSTVIELNKYIDVIADNDTNNNISSVEMRIYYTDAEVTSANLDESTLRMYKYNESTVTWDLISPGGVDTSLNYVWGNVSGFSSFGVFGDAVSDGGVGGGGGGSGGSGKGAPTIIKESALEYECSTSSDCESNQYCFEHECHEAECFDDSGCKGVESCWNHRCMKWFDVEILEFESPVKVGEFFDFTYFLKAMEGIEGDVEIRFWIEQDGNTVTSGQDTIYFSSFEEKTKTKNLFLPKSISSGTYIFYVKVVYGLYTAKAHRTIGINVEEGVATIKPRFGLKTFGSAIGDFFAGNKKNLLVAVGIVLFVLFVLLGSSYIKKNNRIEEIIIIGELLKRGLILILILSLLITPIVWIYLSPHKYYILKGIVVFIFVFMLFSLIKKFIKIRFKSKKEQKQEILKNLKENFTKKEKTRRYIYIIKKVIYELLYIYYRLFNMKKEVIEEIARERRLKAREKSIKAREKRKIRREFLHHYFGLFKTRAELREIARKKKEKEERRRNRLRFLHDYFGLFKTPEEIRKIERERDLRITKKAREKEKKIEAKERRIREEERIIAKAKARKEERERNRIQFLHHYFGLFKTLEEIRKIERERKLKITRKIKAKELKEREKKRRQEKKIRDEERKIRGKERERKDEEERRIRREEERKQRKITRERIKQFNKKTREEERINKRIEKTRRVTTEKLKPVQEKRRREKERITILERAKQKELKMLQEMRRQEREKEKIKFTEKRDKEELLKRIEKERIDALNSKIRDYELKRDKEKRMAERRIAEKESEKRKREKEKARLFYEKRREKERRTAERRNRREYAKKRTIKFLHDYFGLFKTKEDVSKIEEEKNKEKVRRFKEKYARDKNRERMRMLKIREKEKRIDFKRKMELLKRPSLREVIVRRKIEKMELMVAREKQRKKEKERERKEELRIIRAKQRERELERKRKLKNMREEERIKRRIEIQKESTVRKKLKEWEYKKGK